MQKFIERMQEEKSPHERRQFAVRVAGGITAVLFIGWLATLGVRLGGLQSEVANTQNSAQTASVGSIIPVQKNSLMVATSSVFGN